MGSAALANAPTLINWSPGDGNLHASEDLKTKLPMKLTSIEATAAYPPNGSGQGIPIIEVQTQDGMAGWGEAQASRVPEAICDIVREVLSPLLKNRSFAGDCAEIESAWDRMYAAMRNDGQTGGFMLEAISAVDIALWDLAGKIHCQPIHEIAGDPLNASRVEAFASLPCLDADVLEGVVMSLRDAGFQVFELTHDHSEEELIPALDALKRILPEDGRVAVNACWRFHPEWDFRFERELDRHAPLWLANPLPPEDPFAHGRLAKILSSPVALGESYHTHYELAPFFQKHAIGVLQLDLGRCGLTEAFRMAKVARNHHIPVVVRVGESLGPQLAAALQFAAAAPGRRVEYSHQRLQAANRVLTERIELQRAAYQVPCGAGLGIGI